MGCQPDPPPRRLIVVGALACGDTLARMDASIRMLRVEDLLAGGHSKRGIRAKLLSGALVRLRPGVFVHGADWVRTKPETRIVTRARALAAVSSTRPVFSHETAAALHGLPLYRAEADGVHAIVPLARPGAAVGVVRHRGDVEDGILDIHGLLCTNLIRTVADTARTMTFEQAVTIADSALRLKCVRRTGEYDARLADEFRDHARETVRRSAQGLRRAERALDFADGRAQLPGESLSRIRLSELGFQRLGLQVRVPGPEGSAYYVDFELEEARAFGEFDGTIKYVDGKMLDGRTTADVFDREKQREDWIRGRTQHRFVRWGWPHLSTTIELGRRLAAFGVHPPHG